MASYVICMASHIIYMAVDTRDMAIGVMQHRVIVPSLERRAGQAAGDGVDIGDDVFILAAVRAALFKEAAQLAAVNIQAIALSGYFKVAIDFQGAHIHITAHTQNGVFYLLSQLSHGRGHLFQLGT